MVAAQGQLIRFYTGMLMVFLLSCGIFSPRDSEMPQPTDDGRLDPLSFHEIMDNTPYQYPGIPYEDLFTDDIVYVDMKSEKYNKTRLVQRIQQIQLNRSLRVTWQRTNDPLKRGNDTLLFSGLRYNVRLSGILDSPPDDSGSSDMTMVRISSNWRICQWRDVPDGAGISYFSPR
ncbi:MAG: hypothetical protein MUF22_00635 [Chitinispirillaceae bacterium]|jgi:hypothetical protein|nr:hypothetical protein [Chitinispirillaceae bacterium]